MGDGNIKNIENVHAGDSVKTYNLETKKIENNIVSKIDAPYHEHFIQIQFDNGIVNTNTANHPYYVKRKGWCSFAPEETNVKYNLEVDQLDEGDICYYLKDEKIVEVKVINISKIKKMQKTYNLSKVSNNKNYFANGVLVHNK